MSYVVLARKWRPTQFEDLVGQEAVARTLKNAIALGRLHHGLLFTGTRGVGKTTTARIVAKALNCEKGPTAQPCGVCTHCKEISAGVHIDVLEIDGASNTSVDDIRELREAVRYAPSKAKHKVFIIDEVHMLSNSAFNALLKTLEEPPPAVFFIFATTEVHKIPDTILSRVQRFDLREISEDPIAAHLEHIAKAESIHVAASSLKVIARQAQGSMRDALSLFDQVIAFGANDKLEVNDAEVFQILGLTDRALIERTLQSFVRYDTKAALESLWNVISAGFDLKSFLLDLIEAISEALFVQARAKPGPLATWAQGLQEVTVSELERWFEILKRAVEDLPRALVPRQGLELAFMKVTHRPSGLPLQTLIERLEALEKRLSATPAATTTVPVSSGKPPVGSATPTGSGKAPGGIPSGGPSGSSGQASSASPVSYPPIATSSKPPEKLTLSQETLVQELRRQKPMLAALVEQAKAFELQASTLVLGFEEGSFYLSKAQDKSFAPALETLVKAQFGKNLRVSVQSRVAAASQATAPTAMDLLKDRQKEALGHPVIKEAMRVFQANVEDVRSLE